MTSPVRAPRPTPRREELAPVHDLRPDLRVVPAPLRARRTGAVVAVATVVVFGSLLASAVFHSILVSGQHHLDGVDRQVQQEREDLRRDQLKLARAQAPQRIAAAAAAQGMVPTDEQTWLSSDGGPSVKTGVGSAEATTSDDGEGTTADGTGTTGGAGSGSQGSDGTATTDTGAGASTSGGDAR